MTAWEYGFIYVVHTVGPAPAICLVADRSGSRILGGCHGLLRAANLLGAEGWMVSGHGEKSACPVWINDLVSPIEGVALSSTPGRVGCVRSVEESTPSSKRSS